MFISCVVPIGRLLAFNGREQRMREKQSKCFGQKMRSSKLPTPWPLHWKNLNVFNFCIPKFLHRVDRIALLDCGFTTLSSRTSCEVIDMLVHVWCEFFVQDKHKNITHDKKTTAGSSQGRGGNTNEHNKTVRPKVSKSPCSARGPHTLHGILEEVPWFSLFHNHLVVSFVQ